MELIAGVPQAGGYFSLGKIIMMLILPIPWLLALPWVDKDIKRLYLPQTFWSLLGMAGGTTGLLLWILIPTYAIGLLIFVFLAGAPLVFYVLYRNSQVPEDARVLTPAHLAGIFSKKQVKAAVEVEHKVKLYGANSRIVMAPVIGKATEDEILVYNVVQDLLYEMLWRRASEADLSPAGESARLLLVIDGVGVERPRLSLSDAEAAVQYIKQHAGLNVEDHRRPQQGKFAVDLGSRHMDVVVTTAGTTHGQRAQFKLVQESVRTNMSDLGMDEDLMVKVRQISKADHGLIIVSGRPRHGVTSTLYSLLREYDAFVKLLMTVEAKPAVEMENVTQNAYGEADKLPGALATLIRRDPDVLLIDQCPDAKTAQLIIEAASTKHVLLGMHATDSFSALARWLKVAGNAQEAVGVLRGVLCQELVRKLCEGCREAYRPDPQLLAKANLQSQKIDRFYRPPSRQVTDEKGVPIICSACQGIGYVGRIGVFELLEMTDDLRHLVLSGASVSQIKSEARKTRMLYLQERALQKVISGVTSIQEVIRVSQQEQAR